jgi:hypothetical protein
MYICQGYRFLHGSDGMIVFVFHFVGPIFFGPSEIGITFKFNVTYCSTRLFIPEIYSLHLSGSIYFFFTVYLTQYFKIVILTYCFKILSFGNTIYACIIQHLRILLINTAIIMGGCRDRDRMVFGFTLTMQSVP